MIFYQKTSGMHRFFDITGTPRADTKVGNRSAQAMVQLTNIGLAWKVTNDKAFLYAFSCDTGTPLSGVKIDMIGSDANILESSKTDASECITMDRTKAFTIFSLALKTIRI
jgi:uncharacterized protein YfaS (alpha-2-macroglobulin family)